MDIVFFFFFFIISMASSCKVNLNEYLIKLFVVIQKFKYI